MLTRHHLDCFLMFPEMRHNLLMRDGKLNDISIDGQTRHVGLFLGSAYVSFQCSDS